MGTTDTRHGTDAQTPAADGDITRFRLDCLFVTMSLGGTPGADIGDCPHGLAIKEALDAEYGPDAVVNHGRLYPNLDTLVQRGYLEKETHDRRTNAYRVTEAGAAVLEHRVNWARDCLAAGYRRNDG